MATLFERALRRRAIVGGVIGAVLVVLTWWLVESLNDVAEAETPAVSTGGREP